MRTGGRASSFEERRYFRRGGFAPFYASALPLLLAGAVFLDDRALRTLMVVAALAIAATLLLTFETHVRNGALEMRVAPLWRKRIPLDDVVRVEVVVADHQVDVFGGWNARANDVSALTASAEGDRSVGNRAVLLHLRSGRTHQIGTFHPTALVSAIEAGMRHPASTARVLPPRGAHPRW